MPEVLATRAAVTLLAAVIACAGCASRQAMLQQRQEKLASLGASTQLIAEGWLAGTLTATFAKTALDATFAQVEQQRAALAATPDTIVDARGARLAQQADTLSRLIARMIHDVAATDAAGVRRSLAAIPAVPESQ